MKVQRGAGSAEAMLIIAIVVYFLFMGYLGEATHYTSTHIGALGTWQIPILHAGCSGGFVCDVTKVFTRTLDVLLVGVNIILWFFQLLASFFVLLGFGFTGDLPLWVTAFLFTPVGFGMGWLILSQVRGKSG